VAVAASMGSRKRENNEQLVPVPHNVPLLAVFGVFLFSTGQILGGWRIGANVNNKIAKKSRTRMKSQFRPQPPGERRPSTKPNDTLSKKVTINSLFSISCKI
jgi:hypothetical protein